LYNFQLILLTFLFWTPRCCRKFLLNSLWSFASVWYCQKQHLTTHTSYFLNTSLTNNFSLHITPLHTWPVLKNFLFIRDNVWDQTAGCLITECFFIIIYCMLHHNRDTTCSLTILIVHLSYIYWTIMYL
jgi:hypothetical protein